MTFQSLSTFNRLRFVALVMPPRERVRNTLGEEGIGKLTNTATPLLETLSVLDPGLRALVVSSPAPQSRATANELIRHLSMRFPKGKHACLIEKGLALREWNYGQKDASAAGICTALNSSDLKQKTCSALFIVGHDPHPNGILSFLLKSDKASARFQDWAAGNPEGIADLGRAEIVAIDFQGEDLFHSRLCGTDDD